MNETLKIITNFLIDMVSTILISLICILIRKAISWLTNRIEDDYSKKAIEELESVVLEGIYYTEQTLVSKYKEKGTWNEEAKKEACEQCLEYILNSLTEQNKSYLMNTINSSIENLIRNKIEATLGEIHST